MTQAQVEAGVSFAAACQRLKESYQARQRTWASYGDYDRRQLERQCQAENIPYPFGPTHLNVKNLLALRRQLPAEVGLAEGLVLLDLPLEGTHHRGGDDAWNIAAILARLQFEA